MPRKPGAGVYEDGRVEVHLYGERNGRAELLSDGHVHFATNIETWREANRKVEELAEHWPNFVDLHEHRDRRHVHVALDLSGPVP